MRLQHYANGRTMQKYEIRGIVEKALKIQASGKPVFWENIGDPVHKGLGVPDWIKALVSKAVLTDVSYAYCDSKGIKETRSFLAGLSNRLNGNQINLNDIAFFNGLGDAIARVYGLLPFQARVLLPSPTYPAHSGAEAGRIHQKPLTYSCHPQNNWLPDLDEVNNIVEANPEVCALLIINPDNPTGTVWPRDLLSGMVSIAEKHGLFIICDEIYENIVYEGEMTRLCEVLGDDVPAIIMKGISKEFPWPGSRCGWVQYHNRTKCDAFSSLCDAIDHGKMTEVCSTTLPQVVIPAIMSHPEYGSWKTSNQWILFQKMTQIREMIATVPGFGCSGGGGAFYATVHLENPDESGLPLSVISETDRQLIESWMQPDQAQDYALTYYLLACHGICAVPLSSFGTTQCGIRITLLEQDENRFALLLSTLQDALKAWSSEAKKNRLKQKSAAQEV